MQHERPRNSNSTFLVGQAATSTTAAQVVAPTNQGSRSDITLLNIDATDTIYIGKDNTVTSSKGFPLAPGASITIKTWNAIWAISGANTPSLAFIGGEDVQ